MMQRCFAVFDTFSTSPKCSSRWFWLDCPGRGNLTSARPFNPVPRRQFPVSLDLGNELGNVLPWLVEDKESTRVLCGFSFPCDLFCSFPLALFGPYCRVEIWMTFAGKQIDIMDDV